MLCYLLTSLLLLNGIHFIHSQTVDPLYEYYQLVAGQDQQIDARELQKALENLAVKPASLGVARTMIIMLDRDFSGKMAFSEFKECFSVINLWRTTFANYDLDKDGTLQPDELQSFLSNSGYRLSPQALGVVLRRFSTDEKMEFGDFVQSAIKLRTLTDHFRKRDLESTGNAYLSYDDFIQIAMYV